MMKINLLANAGKSGSSGDERKRKPSDGSSRRQRPLTFRVESMDHHVSGLSVTGCVLLALSSLACALSLIAPFWLLYPVRAIPFGSGQIRTQANGSNGVRSRATVAPAPLLPDLVAAPPPPLPPPASIVNSSLRASAVDNGVTGNGHTSTNRGVRRPGVSRPPAINDAWTEGLWAKCYLVDRRCDWFWKDNFVVQSSFEGWHHAAQGLFTTGTLLLLTLFVIVTCNVCCRCCRLSPSFSFVVGSLVIASLVLTAVALTVYGGFQAKVQRWTAPTNGLTTSTTRSRLYWAYYVGVAGTLSAVVAAALFFCDGCSRRRHRILAGYRKTVVV